MDFVDIDENCNREYYYKKMPKNCSDMRRSFDNTFLKEYGRYPSRTEVPLLLSYPTGDIKVDEDKVTYTVKHKGVTHYKVIEGSHKIVNHVLALWVQKYYSLYNVMPSNHDISTFHEHQKVLCVHKRQFIYNLLNDLGIVDCKEVKQYIWCLEH